MDYLWDDSGTPPNDWLPVSNRRGVILAIEPYQAVGGSEVTIYGFNFGWIPGAVWVGGISIQPNTWSDTRITFDLPAEVTAGNRTITVAPYTQLWASATFTVVPQISQVFPTDVTGGTTLYLSGTGFGDNPADGTVLIDSLPALVPLWSPYQLGALIPKTASPGDVTVFTTVNGISSNAAQITVMPFVFTASVAPLNGSTLLTVGGRNFGTPVTDGVFELLLDGQPLGTTRWDAQTIQAPLPEKLANGEHTVIVIAASLASNFFEFSITNNRLVGGFASSTTSPGNSWKRNAAHQALLYAEKYYGQGELLVQEMEGQAELSELTDGEIPLELAFTVKEGTTKTVTLHIDNPGDGVLYFNGWAYRCLAHSIFSVYAPRSMKTFDSHLPRWARTDISHPAGAASTKDISPQRHITVL